LKDQALIGLQKCVTPEEEGGDDDDDCHRVENCMQALFCLIDIHLK
jgi:hypothetical protein